MSSQSQPWQISSLDQLDQQAVLKKTHVTNSNEKAGVKQSTAGIPAHPIHRIMESYNGLGWKGP